MDTQDGRELLNAVLPARKENSHKGDYGRLGMLCGSLGLTGAPYFAAQAAVCSGAGLVHIAVPRSVYHIVAVKLNEAMAYPVADELGAVSEDALGDIIRIFGAADACLAGCGLGRSAGVAAIMQAIVSSPGAPLVLDADGINAITRHINLIGASPREIVLTPHDGELARLLGGDISEPGETRPDAARRLATKTGATLVMKGHNSVVASPDGRIFVNSTGNPGMAKGGSGDVLAGIITAFIGQSGRVFESAAAGVYIHGLAGDMAAREKGEVGMTPTDLLSKLPEAIFSCRGR